MQLESLKDVIKKHVLTTYDYCGQNVTRTCRVLKIGRTSLYRYLERYDVELPSKRLRREQGL